MIGISRTKFYDLVKQGKIRCIKIGGRTLVSHTEALRLISDASGEISK
eukprot:gene7744-7807_t